MDLQARDSQRRSRKSLSSRPSGNRSTAWSTTKCSCPLRKPRTSLLPSTMTHQRLFKHPADRFSFHSKHIVIRLGRTARFVVLGQDLPLLLKAYCCTTPTQPSRARLIIDPVEAFVQWLEGECFIENVWLPSIDVKLTCA